MISRIRTAALFGIEAVPVDVEAATGSGQARFSIVGLGDNAVRESRDRVFSAIKNSGFNVPDQAIVNLAPAELKKEGSAFDLPIALSVICASGQIQFADSNRWTIFGELSLDGSVKPIRGVVAYAVCAIQNGIQEIIVPHENVKEARLLKEVSVVGIGSLLEAVLYLAKGERPKQRSSVAESPAVEDPRSFCDVIGQETAKRALLIAASGRHNILLVGPPGCGKSMLAERFSSILPPLSQEERLDTVRVHSIAGQDISRLLSGQRPFRSPHHTISDAGLIGGGSIPRPGEVSLSHHGVLFLDEFPEYRRSAVEALRLPLESGAVTISRAKGHVRLPAKFQLIAAMNPCPCGRMGTTNPCSCSHSAVSSYLRKLSQPILDRIDLQVEVQTIPLEALSERRSVKKDTSLSLLERVMRTQKVQLQRQGVLNGELDSEQARKQIQVSTVSRKLIERAASERFFSARGYIRLLRVAQTIADLDELPEVDPKHIAEALGLRSLDRIARYIGGSASNRFGNVSSTTC